MATKQSTVDYILDQLVSVGDVSAKKMFGGYVLYYGDKVVGLVCDDKLFVKITESGKKFVGRRYREGHAYPGAKTSMYIDEDQIDDRAWLCELIRITAKNVPNPKKKFKQTKVAK